MLFASSFLSVTTLALGLLASLASAELHQGPSGTVEYGKRFQVSQVSSTTPCIWICPAVDFYNPTTEMHMNYYTRFNEYLGVDDGERTACSYVLLYAGGAAEGKSVVCYFDSITGENTGVYADDEFAAQVTCAATADSFNGSARQSCTVPVKRNLSRLEKIVRSRQYKFSKA